MRDGIPAHHGRLVTPPSRRSHAARARALDATTRPDHEPAHAAVDVRDRRRAAARHRALGLCRRREPRVGRRSLRPLLAPVRHAMGRQRRAVQAAGHRLGDALGRRHPASPRQGRERAHDDGRVRARARRRDLDHDVPHMMHLFEYILFINRKANLLKYEHSCWLDYWIQPACRVC